MAEATDAPGSKENPIEITQKLEEESVTDPYPSIRKRKADPSTTTVVPKDGYPDPFSTRFNEMRRLKHELIAHRHLLREKADGLDPKLADWLVGQHMSDLLGSVSMLPEVNMSPFFCAAQTCSLSFHTHLEKIIVKESLVMPYAHESLPPKEAPPEIMVSGESLREFAVTLAKKE